MSRVRSLAMRSLAAAIGIQLVLAQAPLTTLGQVPKASAFDNVVVQEFLSTDGVNFVPNLVGAAAVRAGQRITVRVAYHNASDHAYDSASVLAQLPAGFTAVPGTTKTCLNPAPGELICNTSAGQGGAIIENAVWAGNTLRISPTAGLFAVSPAQTAGILEMGKKRYLNFQNCDYALRNGWNTDDIFGFQVSNGSLGTNITCGPGDIYTYLRPQLSLRQPVDIFGNRYVNMQNCDYSLTNNLNTDDNVGFAPSNNPFTTLSCNTATDPNVYYRPQNSLVQSVDHLGKRYLNFQNCDYINAQNGNTDDIVGFAPSNTPQSALTCGNPNPAAPLRAVNSMFDPLDLFESARGRGYVEFAVTAPAQSGTYTADVAVTAPALGTMNAGAQIQVLGPTFTIAHALSTTVATPGSTVTQAITVTNNGPVASTATEILAFGASTPYLTVTSVKVNGVVTNCAAENTYPNTNGRRCTGITVPANGGTANIEATYAVAANTPCNSQLAFNGAAGASYVTSAYSPTTYIPVRCAAAPTFTIGQALSATSTTPGGSLVQILSVRNTSTTPTSIAEILSFGASTPNLTLTGLKVNGVPQNCAAENTYANTIGRRCTGISIPAAGTATIEATYAVAANAACGSQLAFNGAAGATNSTAVYTPTMYIPVSCNSVATCADGLNNDGDTGADAADADCHTDGNPYNAGSYDGTRSEANPNNAACANRLDDDSDGQVDINDAGCYTNGVYVPADQDEYSNNSSSSSTSSSSSSSSQSTTITLAGHPQVNQGSALPYVLTYANGAVPVQFTLPVGTTLNTQYTPGFCTQQGSIVTCTPPAGQSSFVYYINVTNTVSCGIDLLMTASTLSGTRSNTVTTRVTCNGNSSSSSSSSSSQVPACRDGIDNDGDGKIDFAQDGGCSSPDDTDESGVTQCSDRTDNDHDGWVDLDDMDCTNAQDNSEGTSTPTFQCNDGRDNDGDGLVDLNDPGCTSPYDDTELNQSVQACMDQTFEYDPNQTNGSFYTDIGLQSPVGQAALAMQCRDIMNGFADRTFRPNQLTNRAEASKFFLRAIGTSVPHYTGTALPFSDVQLGQWYIDFVVRANQLGIVQGDPSGTFRPAAAVNVAEFATMAARAFNYNNGTAHGCANIPSFADQGVKLMRDAGMACPNASQTMSRQDVAIAMQQILGFLGR